MILTCHFVPSISIDDPKKNASLEILPKPAYLLFLLMPSQCPSWRVALAVPIQSVNLISDLCGPLVVFLFYGNI